MKKITISDGVWFLFLICVFTPSLVMSFATGELSVSDTYSYVFGTIAGFAGEWIAYILFLPLGFITCLLPNDSYYVLTAFQMVVGDFAILAIFLFVCTTYPPTFIRRTSQPAESPQAA
ncbi:hypothetical protein [Pseudomonas sp. TH31]|uniref:hypothetical protein n=1 Tax=Pseudomonas sp. TH31 TaxID=2796396 RepID=UPI00191224F2|nr:hypothetical protein [Pseudomonas sp. TH31]MBK5417754.1 hypothetical protein [Pseudomonas sp. TH31]